jgi:hypothetical protein
MNQTWLEPKLKTKSNDIHLTPKLIYVAIKTPVITVSNLSYFRIDLIQFYLTWIVSFSLSSRWFVLESPTSWMDNSLASFLKPWEFFSYQQSSLTTLDESSSRSISYIIIAMFFLLSFWSLLGIHCCR